MADTLTAPTAPTLAPISPAERSPIMDGIRGFAVLGILAMNIPEFALPEANFFNPLVGGHDGTDRAVWWFSRLVFDMKMQSLFSMLFGAGLVVLGSRALRAGRSLTPLFYRRVALLAAMGILHGYLLWYGDILWTYALIGALIYPLRRLPTAWMLALGLALFLLGAILTSGLGGAMWWMRDQATQAQSILDAGGTPQGLRAEMLDTWKEINSDFHPTPEILAEEEAAIRGSFLDVALHRAPATLELQIGPPFWIISLWRFSGYMLLGLACMRLGVFTGALKDSAYAAMLILGYGVGLPIVALGALRAEAHSFDFVDTFLTGFDFNYFASLFVAFGHVGALTLLFKSPATAWILPGLAAVGRMALTNYLTQSLLCAAFFNGWGLDQWNRLSKTEIAAVVIAIWTLQIIWSILWLRHFRLGPMEYLWRRLTYGSLARPG
jgi:uncharacterized protein